MARAGARVIVGVWIVLAVGLLVVPALSAANAQPRDPSPAVAQVSATSVFGATTTRPEVTTTVPVTTPPTSSSVSTTPTTIERTPTTFRQRVFIPATSSTTAAPTTTTSTTLAAPLPPPAQPPVTLPLANAAESGSINAFFPIMSGVGLGILVILLAAQWFLTKPGRRGPTL